MTKAAINPVLNFKNWSVTDWSVEHNLVTLMLGRFRIESSELNRNPGIYGLGSCSFIRPAYVNFSEFTASTDAVIQEIVVSPPAKGLTKYRFEFEDDSFIEIEAREVATKEW